jgi:hypothetical protein
MEISHASFYEFNSINDTHLKKVATLTTYLWDVKNTHDLIDS